MTETIRFRAMTYNVKHGDTSATFYIGKPSAEAMKVVEVARKSLELGIAEVKPGARLPSPGVVRERAMYAFAHDRALGAMVGMVVGPFDEERDNVLQSAAVLQMGKPRRWGQPGRASPRASRP